MRRSTWLRTAQMAALVAGTQSLPASAADMLSAPPPPPMMAPAPHIDAGGGFYLRGDIGVSNHDNGGVFLAPGGANFQTMSSSLGNSVFLGVGAGYAYNSWLRGDATIEYRSAAKFRISELDTRGTAGTGDDGINVTTGKVSAVVGLLNGYVDLGTWHRITPFIGAGAGFATIFTNDVRDVGYAAFAGGTGSAPSKTDTRFAWAIHAGLGYDLSTNLKAEVGYRYLNMGTVNTANVACTIPCTTFNARIKDLSSHDIKFGMRYIFADAAPAFAPGPLVRKY
ncbi:outer membrane beta-barrel protein [Rhabdaerophilum sp. SD176]|uniref:outer membrane protein n=1 Tax=Rhabdaerophilum sp. SD176 TaxID=2983548 RepID=UPI0024DFF9A1|nr:outer membrane beta-barrel protein [Rhabdaerophilum sp. SD176]